MDWHLYAVLGINLRRNELSSCLREAKISPLHVGAPPTALFPSSCHLIIHLWQWPREDSTYEWGGTPAMDWHLCAVLGINSRKHKLVHACARPRSVHSITFASLPVIPQTVSRRHTIRNDAPGSLLAFNLSQYKGRDLAVSTRQSWERDHTGKA